MHCIKRKYLFFRSKDIIRVIEKFLSALYNCHIVSHQIFTINIRFAVKTTSADAWKIMNSWIYNNIDIEFHLKKNTVIIIQNGNHISYAITKYMKLAGATCKTIAVQKMLFLFYSLGYNSRSYFKTHIF